MNEFEWVGLCDLSTESARAKKDCWDDGLWSFGGALDGASMNCVICDWVLGPPRFVGLETADGGRRCVAGGVGG